MKGRPIRFSCDYTQKKGALPTFIIKPYMLLIKIKYDAEVSKTSFF